MKTILESKQIELRYLSISEINSKLSYYEDKHIFMEDDVVVKDKEFTRNGIALTSTLESTKNMEYVGNEIPIEWMDKKKGITCCVRKEDWNKMMNGEIHVSDLFYGRLFSKDGYDTDKYVYFIGNPDSWQIADLEGNRIYYPIYFDYDDTRELTSGKYDLEKVLEYMRSNPKFIVPKFNKPSYMTSNNELELIKIPDFDADDEDTVIYAIEFMYLPDDSDNLYSTKKSNFIKQHFKKFKKM